jgi:hypothetical protein
MNNSTRTILAGVVLALLVGALALVIPAAASLLWVTVMAMWLAITAMVLTTLFAVGGRRADGPQALVFPILAWQFLGLHGLLSVVVLLLDAVGVWSMPWAVLLVGHLVILGVFTLLLLAASAGKEEIDQAQTVVREKVTDWRVLMADVAAARDRIPRGNPEAAVALKAVEGIHDALRYSDPMSIPALASIEEELRSAISELAGATGAAQWQSVPRLADRIQSVLKDRNTRVKALK